MPKKVTDIFKSNSKATFSEPEGKSKGILDDFAVRKVINTQEGTIEKVPVNSNDIVNKTYVDQEITNLSGAQNLQRVTDIGKTTTNDITAAGFISTAATDFKTNQTGTISEDTTKLTILPKAGHYTKIGDASTTSHTLALNDDLHVSGNLEVDTTLFQDGGMVFAADRAFEFSNVGCKIEYNTATQTTDTLIWTLPPSNNIIFSDWDSRDADHDHTTQTNPTIFVQSATNPNTDNTQWISFTHNQTDGVITTGKGDLFLSPAGGEVKFGTYTAGAATDSTGYITIIDAAGNIRKLMVQA